MSNESTFAYFLFLKSLDNNYYSYLYHVSSRASLLTMLKSCEAFLVSKYPILCHSIMY